MRDAAGFDAPDARELAERLAAGDRGAAAWLYDQVAPDLYRRLSRRYGYSGGPDAADLLQDAFLLCLRDEARLLRNVLADQPTGAPALPPIQRYLWDLACGVAANARRSVWSRRVQPMPEAPLPDPAQVERSAVSRQALERIDGCLRQQGERTYLYFKLRYVDGLAPEEISAGTGWSKKATYKLRQALNEAVERCLDRLGLRAGAWLPALAAAALLSSLASACRPPALAVPVVVRGHQEVVVDSSGKPRPLVLGPGGKVGLCFAAPAGEDTSRWEAELTFDGKASPTGFAVASARAGSTLCFDGAVPPRLRESSRIALCGRLVDRFDAKTRSLPCRDIAYRPDREKFDSLKRQMDALVAEQASQPIGEFLRRLDRLVDPDLPLTTARLDLVAVHFLLLEGTPAALAEARRRFARLPSWLGEDAALERAVQASYQRGRLELAGGSRTAAWLAFRDAEERAVRIADPTLLEVVLQQADLLSQAGAPDEALQRVKDAVGQCGSLGCGPERVAYARMQLAWLTLLHSDATPEQLAIARSGLRAALPAVPAERDPYEAANQRINLAYLELRTGRDPRTLIQTARRIAASPGTGSGGRQTLDGWISLLAGLAAIERGEPRAALADCGSIATVDPQLEAARLSCEGRAHRLAGDLAEAARAFDAALVQHGRIAAGLDQRLPLGPGERAEDFARAARVAIERGDPEAAWRLLLLLDSLSAQERERESCRALARGADARRWADLDRESDGLLRDLAALPRVASASRERQADALRVALEERLRRLWREWPGCAASATPEDRGVDFRAFAVEDEVILLRRDAGGRVGVERRSRLPRRQRLATLQALAAEVEAGRGEPGRWRSLCEPVARAILPLRPGVLGPVTTFALHGSLQLVPLAAMPLPDGRWLGEETSVALYTAGAHSAIGGGRKAAHPVLVVDPAGDLAGAERSLSAYRSLFPDGRILRGGDATRAAVRGALAEAEWLHVDAHASYDPVFPEMSRLQLADGDLGLIEWSRLPAPRRFANLSGCRTASWPVTADSGQYGLGGLLARLGAGWVVATRGPIPDDAAYLYNRAFYSAISQGRAVPDAHASGLAAVRARHPPQVWGAILLLRSGTGGQNTVRTTPTR